MLKKLAKCIFSIVLCFSLIGSMIIGYAPLKVHADGGGGKKDIYVTVDAPEGLCEGISIDGQPVDDKTNKVSVESGRDTRSIGICIALGKAISKVIINGEEITEIPQTVEGWITFNNVVNAESYTIKLYEGESDDITMLWVYDQATADKNGFGEDAVVENGKVELLSIRRNGENIPFGDVSDEEGGYVMLKKGDDITVKLIPDYGYQLKSVSVNEQELEPQEDVSTFELRNLQGNIHFSGVFVKSNDITNSTSKTVTNPVISSGRNAASSGNLSLNITDNSAYTKDVTTAVSNGNATAIASLDLSLDNIVSKGNGENWTTKITEFSNPISISMNVSDTALNVGETYGIVRDHNGTLTELDAKYSNGVLTFETNRFSTYTLIKKSTIVNGDKVTDSVTGAKVKVVDANNKEVSFTAPKSKSAKTVKIPNTVEINGVSYKVTKIEDKAFKGNKKVEKITLPKNIKTIGKDAFNGAKNLKTVSISSNLTAIGNNAFKNCAKLTKISLPSKTTKIGSNAFSGCKKLKTITLKSTKLTKKTISKNAFKGLTKSTTIKVPKSKLKAYKTLFKSKGLSSKVKVKK